MNKFYVEQKYFDNGGIRTSIIDVKNASKDYYDGLSKEFEDYDLYVDGFETLRQAKEYAMDCQNA